MSLLELLRSPAPKKLLDILIKLPQLGVGSRVTRQSWEPHGDSYYDLTQVKPRKPDGSAGKVIRDRAGRVRLAAAAGLGGVGVMAMTEHLPACEHYCYPMCNTP